MHASGCTQSCALLRPIIQHACTPASCLALPPHRLQEIQSVAGRAAPRGEVLDALMEGDFDPEEYDRRMAAAFGDEYYGAVRGVGAWA